MTDLHDKLQDILIKWGITSELGFAHKLAIALESAFEKDEEIMKKKVFEGLTRPDWEEEAYWLGGVGENTALRFPAVFSEKGDYKYHMIPPVKIRITVEEIEGETK